MSSAKPEVVIVIPARYGSTRLPGKPLVSLAGQPMIQRVYERAKMAQTANRVIVATDDERIVKAVESFGGTARMTRPDHRTGTERVAEVAAHEKGDVFVNVQGDEPLVRPEQIDALLRPMLRRADVLVSTVATACAPKQIGNPNAVKVVTAADGRALYFARATIPHDRDGLSSVKYQKHLGLYAYRKAALDRFPTLPASALEVAERLEGMSRNASVHAAGVVIAPAPLKELVPLYKTNKDEIVTQYDMVGL